MDTEGDPVDPSVEFLYKAMLCRDPKKRRVKPVQKHLLQLDFGGLDDSSEDEDFKVAENKDSEASDDGEDGDEYSGDGENSHNLDSGSGSDDEEAEEDEEEQESSSIGGSGVGDDLAGITVGELIQRAKLKGPVWTEDTSNSSAAKLKVQICCVCLGDGSEEDDEIVECDGCGVSVHEGCYGISESQSVASTESSASTEPWFCDACKAGTKPSCELCPNSGGIYKETDTGKWVHIVCALYIPGVAFGDVDRLSPVTLLEMPYSKWGARECCLCEDERFSCTGVCIGCDAGMCRSYFHVTCAQREGLLSEASPEEDIADPFYAYCKQHAEKNSVKARRRNWLAEKSNHKQRAETEIPDLKERNGEQNGLDLEAAQKFRVQRKLERHRRKYVEAKTTRPPVWVPSEKMSRLLTSSPSAMRRLMRKAELMGINTQVQNSGNKDIRKKWHVAPALSVEFVSYYLDRNIRMSNMKLHLGDLLSQRDRLREQEKTMRSKYDQMSGDVSTLKETNNTLQAKAEKVWKAIIAFSDKPLSMPEIIKPKKPVKSPKKEVVISPLPCTTTIINQCATCYKTHDQHLLAKCDMCTFFYHLGCLDPPLTRMPKKTRLMGWQCSNCASSGSEESGEEDVDPDAPRRLREKINEPKKFMPFLKEKKKKRKRKKKIVKEELAPPPMDVMAEEEGADRLQRAKVSPSADSLPEGGDETRVQRVKKKRRRLLEETEEAEMPVLKKEKPFRPVREKDVRTECAACNKPGDNRNLVRCDDCTLCYHFHCLDPPLTKSPKQRGYGWLCTACDSSAEEEDPYVNEMVDDSMDFDDAHDDEEEDDLSVVEVTKSDQRSNNKQRSQEEGVMVVSSDGET